MRRSMAAFTCIFSAFAAAQFALSQDWIGSTGTPTNPSQVTLSGAAAYVRPSLSTSTAVLHYSVLPVGDLTTSIVTPGQLTGCRQLFVRYLDNGPDARVVVDLKQVNASTGVTTTLLSWNSDGWPVISNTAFQEASSSCITFDSAFADESVPLGTESGYYFEVTLQRTA